MLLALIVAIASIGLARRGAPTLIETGSPAAYGATVVRYSLRSRFVRGKLAQTAIIPAGSRADSRALLVFLPGRGGRGSESNANRAFFRALRALGSRAPAVVFPDGGDHSYFHARVSGDWARYVLEEVIPEAVQRLHVSARRVAIGGISMGGFGAFDIARMRPSRFCAVGGHSAALWGRADDTASGAFDDAKDFDRNDILAVARASGRAPWGAAHLWLDGGISDPFRESDEELAAALGVRMQHWPGGHDMSYWQAHYASYLRFYAAALATC
ncbi:MAG TPA: alpha/beta hydrolase-fold protein [Baekduia sp.]|nr:alpha/beta hydrolase-fold protein [Baekduia sp.]